MAVTIVAECGLNHGGHLRVALAIITAAKACGADVVKFQTFDPAHVPASHPLRDVLANLTLPRDQTVMLAKHCEQVGIEFVSTPGDIDSLCFLVNKCGVKRIKIGSDDMLNLPLLEAAAKTGMPLIVSTGMASLKEIIDCNQFIRARTSHHLTFMQCTSLYPCPPNLVNLRAMRAWRDFASATGYSDHTAGTTACVAAAALGASIIEKHFMLSDTPDCIDAPVSARPKAFRRMVEKIRDVEKMLGDGRKVHRPEEAEARKRLRKVAEVAA